jgi:hypothetical protein
MKISYSADRRLTVNQENELTLSWQDGVWGFDHPTVTRLQADGLRLLIHGGTSYNLCNNSLRLRLWVLWRVVWFVFKRR